MIDALIPSRGRPDLLARSVKSLRELANGPVTVYVAADDDDPDTATAGQQAGATVLIMPRQGYEGLHVYFAEMAAAGTGEWLLTWNDDAVMLTPGWDTIIEALPPKILIADVQSPHSPLCCFPAIRRRAVDALGKFSSANPHVDTFWQDVGRIAGRILPVPVVASCETPIGAHPTHGFYEREHQIELIAAAAVISGLS